MPKHPLKLRELLAKLKPYDVVALAKRGKGSETILLKPIAPGSKKGPQFPVPYLPVNRIFTDFAVSQKNL